MRGKSYYVSIIVPVYNCERFIEECIVSLQKQSIRELEIILIDDGSTDTSGKICDSYAQKDSRIRVVHKENEGVSVARNTGIALATGDYLAFVDADDCVEERYIEDLYVQLNGADAVIGGYMEMSENGSIYGRVTYEKCKYEGNAIVCNLIPRLLGTMPKEQAQGIFAVVWGRLFDRHIIVENGICFEPNISYSEDLIFQMDYFAHTNNVKVIENSQYLYRINSQSASHIYYSGQFVEIMGQYELICDRISRYKLPKEALWCYQKTMFIFVRGCISQEATWTNCRSQRESVNRIKTICKDAKLQNIVREYPITELLWRQRIFVQLLKFRCAYILYFLARVKMF